MSHLSENLSIFSVGIIHIFFRIEPIRKCVFYENSSNRYRHMIVDIIALHFNGLKHCTSIYISFYVFFKPTISCEEEYRLNLPQACSLLNLVMFPPELEPVQRWPQSTECNKIQYFSSDFPHHNLIIIPWPTRFD